MKSLLNKKIILLTLIILTLFSISVVSADNVMVMKDDSIHQVSIMQAFMHGEYDGVISVGDLKLNGDTGLGTFEGVDGEMIVLDGVVYKAKADGSIQAMPNNERVPFAVVTNFDEDASIPKISANNFSDLTSQLDKELDKLGKNNMYVVKIKGDFSNITVRSIEKQDKPYKEFNDVAKTDQKVFNYTNQSGTIVAVHFPKFMGDVNMAGWHMHFLSDDKTKGGHVLEFNKTNASVGIDIISEFNMLLSSSESFTKMDLSEDMTNKISQVE